MKMAIVVMLVFCGSVGDRWVVVKLRLKVQMVT